MTADEAATSTYGERLRRLARQVGTTLAAEGRCVILCGSTTSGRADRASDIDLYAFTEGADTAAEGGDWRPPSEQAVQVLAGPRGRAGWFSRWSVSDAVLDVEWIPRHFVDDVLRDVVCDNDVDPEKQHLIRGLIDCDVLSGESVIATWLDRIHPYPNALAAAMVRRHLRLRDLARIKARTLDRGDTLGFYAQASVAMLDWMGMLAGINRYYLGVSPVRAKWLPVHLERMPRKPPEMVPRIDRGLRDPTDEHLTDLNRLGESVLNLVEDMFPRVSTRHVRPLA